MNNTDAFHWALRRELLQCQLEVASLRGSFTQEERASWLAQQLREYVSRWTGFVDLNPDHRLNLVDVPGFPLIEIAAELLKRELSSAPMGSGIESAWGVFESRLIAIQHSAVPTDSGSSMSESTPTDLRNSSSQLSIDLNEAVRQLGSALNFT